MHPRIARRLANNLTKVRHLYGKDVAAKWVDERFPHMTKDDFLQVRAILLGETKKPTPPNGA